MSHTQTKSFHALIHESQIPILVDFWAPWCGPCQMMTPVLKEVAQHYGGRLKVIKINVDQKPQIASQYGIQSIPTLMLFAKGESVMRLNGAMSAQQLIQQIDAHWP